MKLLHFPTWPGLGEEAAGDSLYIKRVRTKENNLIILKGFCISIRKSFRFDPLINNGWPEGCFLLFCLFLIHLNEGGKCSPVVWAWLSLQFKSVLCLSPNVLLQHSSFGRLKSALGRFPYQTKQVKQPSYLIHKRPKTVKLYHHSPGSAFYCHLQHNRLWFSPLSEQGCLCDWLPSQNTSYLLSSEDTSLLNINKTTGTCSERRVCAAWPGVGAEAFGQHHGSELYC